MYLGAIMTEYQYRRLNQLTDLLMFKEISNTEYIEYQYLCEMLAVEFETNNVSCRSVQGR